MLTAAMRNALTGKTMVYKVEGMTLDDAGAVKEAITQELGNELQKPILFVIEGGKGGLTTQPEPVQRA